jgi:hypothetical protein
MFCTNPDSSSSKLAALKTHAPVHRLCSVAQYKTSPAAISRARLPAKDAKKSAVREPRHLRHRTIAGRQMARVQIEATNR